MKTRINNLCKKIVAIVLAAIMLVNINAPAMAQDSVKYIKLSITEEQRIENGDTIKQVLADREQRELMADSLELMSKNFKRLQNETKKLQKELKAAKELLEAKEKEIKKLEKKEDNESKARLAEVKKEREGLLEFDGIGFSGKKLLVATIFGAGTFGLILGLVAITERGMIEWADVRVFGYVGFSVFIASLLLLILTGNAPAPLTLHSKTDKGYEDFKNLLREHPEYYGQRQNNGIPAIHINSLIELEQRYPDMKTYRENISAFFEAALDEGFSEIFMKEIEAWAKQYAPAEGVDEEALKKMLAEKRRPTEEEIAQRAELFARIAKVYKPYAEIKKALNEKMYEKTLREISPRVRQMLPQ
jgi:hypothetical protein